jgi:hypothetical protein
VGNVVALIAGAGLAYGVWRTFLSLKRWRQAPAGRDPAAREAEAELWSTKNISTR